MISMLEAIPNTACVLRRRAVSVFCLATTLLNVAEELHCLTEK